MEVMLYRPTPLCNRFPTSYLLPGLFQINGPHNDEGYIIPIMFRGT